jgi:autotransporter-associated beta strand protein
MRISQAARPSATSSFTINAGAQLDLIAAGTFAFGSGPLNLNGAGPTTGPFAAFPGAIRNDTGIIATINNAVVLQSDTMIHVQGTAGSTTLAGAVSGPGKLTLGAQPHDANLGTLALNGANTYSGGTVVDAGTLVVSGASATLGTGNVTVNSANASFAGSAAKLTIQSGVLNAISDTATLSLAGGNAAGTADDGFVELQSGVNETVGGLKLGGVPQVDGTFGSTSSAAANKNDEYFSGSGVITVVAPPQLPTLIITLSAPNALLAWPTNATGFNLVANTNFSLARSNWPPVTNAVVVVGTNNTVTVPFGSSARFFSLLK